MNYPDRPVSVTICNTPSGRLLRVAMELSDRLHITIGEAMDIIRSERDDRPRHVQVRDDGTVMP